MLIVDDDPKVLEALQILLGDDGYRILTADSAAQGFEQLALHEVHVLLCDERMPGMSGTDFLARVKEMHPDTLRIILSSCADEGALIGSINRGEVYRYYQKPWDAASLRENLREAFRHYWHLHDASRAPRTVGGGQRLVALPASAAGRSRRRSSLEVGPTPGSAAGDQRTGRSGGPARR